MYGIVGHGGAGGTSATAERYCMRAVQTGMDVLDGGCALNGAVALVLWMEDSGWFNTGLGAILRVGGEIIEQDAVVATSHGLQGAVGAVRDVKNPILLARAVIRTPHLMLTGEGAREYARQIGLDSHPGPTARTRKRYNSVRRAIEQGRLEAVAPGWTSDELEATWEGLERSVAPASRAGDQRLCGPIAAHAPQRSGKHSGILGGGTGLHGGRAAGELRPFGGHEGGAMFEILLARGAEDEAVGAEGIRGHHGRTSLGAGWRQSSSWPM